MNPEKPDHFTAGKHRLEQLGLLESIPKDIPAVRLGRQIRLRRRRHPLDL